MKMVIRISTSGIPEDRDDRIFRSLIDTRDKFLNYVDMIITDRPQELGALMMVDCEAQAMRSPLLQTRSCSNVYESLLQIADTKPEVLEDIQDIANRLDADIVPQIFAQMTATFIKARYCFFECV